MKSCGQCPQSQRVAPAMRRSASRDLCMLLPPVILRTCFDAVAVPTSAMSVEGALHLLDFFVLCGPCGRRGGRRLKRFHHVFSGFVASVGVKIDTVLLVGLREPLNDDQSETST